MHVLVAFDIVPVESRVPFGVTPASERAIEYTLEVFGTHEGLSVTAVQLSTETIDLEENVGVAEIRSMADELGVSAEIEGHSVRGADSMAELRGEILEFVERADVDTVVLGYEERSFVESVFSGSTPDEILEKRGVPVVLVP